MKQYRYILEPYKGPSTKHQCPECLNKKCFVLYIDIESLEHIHQSVGRCDRESKCAYHLTPKQYFERSGIVRDEHWQPVKAKVTPPKPVRFITQSVLSRSLTRNNNLVMYLSNLFGIETAQKIADQYLVGSAKKWPGANVFYQVDLKGNIRRGKIMLYDRMTGRRDKQKIHSVHALYGMSDNKPPECFFGEHLLNGNHKPVAIVESEKTAIISSVYLPEFVWIACGGLSMLNYDKCQALKGREVVLFPDLGGFERWKEKATLFFPGITSKWKVSNLLEKVATSDEKRDGLDLADYLTRTPINKL